MSLADLYGRLRTDEERDAYEESARLEAVKNRYTLWAAAKPAEKSYSVTCIHGSGVIECSSFDHSIIRECGC